MHQGDENKADFITQWKSEPFQFISKEGVQRTAI